MTVAQPATERAALPQRLGEADREETVLGPVALVTDVGLVHEHNDDAAAAGTAVDAGLDVVALAVCDGVSSCDDPQLASAAAARSGVEALLAGHAAGLEGAAATSDALTAAAAAVVAVAEDHHLRSPSCTYTSALVVARADNTFEITVGNVGDSRAYWFPSGADSLGQRLTLDDSWAQALVSAGVADEEAAMSDPRAHMLTRWLGADANSGPWGTSAVSTLTTAVPGVLVVCSDGLWNYLPTAAELAPFVTAGDPLSAARALVAHALEAGGRDNITVAVVAVGG
ncbi:PP2C family serine/threonine-protein phosphatase [Antrihabitans sp. YC2-6]|uniref:PP2C family protein-serine/threonine phosphatase n=1 Tax=Antrihabitans sp. YC2-6 TaxID=2799498 RepID=UPI0018F55D9D|nr:PP2C family serine/threonine-protein phosphatase [Antrihabitans sp. YC2-6]MBJ8346094.1 serine/threonine-protein phosphatase [Antrihabitans sp. YC2-6]